MAGTIAGPGSWGILERRRPARPIGWRPDVRRQPCRSPAPANRKRGPSRPPWHEQRGGSGAGDLTAAEQQGAAELLRIAPVADELGRRFERAGHELHLVGGSVRDALLGRLGDDLDFATDAHPDQTLAVLAGWAEAIWETGREFGTIGAQRRGLRLEITTFRADAYDGVSRNPVVRYGESLIDDLSRRDFAINAMAVSVPGREFTDPYGGRKDLAKRLIRTPGRPEDSFGDDPLRMLRAARFFRSSAAQLRFAVAPDVIAAMRAMAGDLDRITAERIRDEFMKLLCGADPVAGLRLLVDTGLAERFLPELPGLQLAIDEHAQHKDVYEHTLTVVRNAVRLERDGPDLVLRLAALLHDIGKPATKAIGPDGRVSFHHHEVVGARLTRQRLKALRFPKEISPTSSTWSRFTCASTGTGAASGPTRRYAGTSPTPARCWIGCTPSPGRTAPRATGARRRSWPPTTTRWRSASRGSRREEDLARVRPDLDGNAIMELLGLPPGPLIGEAWRYLKELRLDRGPLAHDEAVDALMTWAAGRGLR